VKLDGIMIWVRDVPATVAFYQAAFGLELQMMNDDKQYAQLTTGETTLSFADETAAKGTGVTVRPNRLDADAPAVQLAFVADDVEAAYQQAVAAGATAEVPLTTKPWGQTLGYVRDINGFLVELSSPAAW
jgi:uncharacterized glyoxalase superfamily protein PhnB